MSRKFEEKKEVEHTLLHTKIGCVKNNNRILLGMKMIAYF